MERQPSDERRVQPDGIVMARPCSARRTAQLASRDRRTRERRRSMRTWPTCAARSRPIEQVAGGRSSSSSTARSMTANENFLRGHGLSPRRDRRPRITACSSTTAYAHERRVPASSGPGWAAASTRRASTSAIGKGGREVWIQAVVQPDPRRQRPAVQGRQVRHRRHRSRSCANADYRGPDRRHRQGAGGHRVQAGRHDRRRPTTTS